MTDGTKKPIVVGLHENVSAFFDQFYEKYSAEMKCGLGCSQCCVQGLSVFPVEAQLIQEWVLSLSEMEKKSLISTWKKNTTEPTQQAKKCEFLSNDTCSIYAARPTICRSQGLPLRVKSATGVVVSDENDFELSMCELNFVDENKIPNPSEWLDLDRLNTLLSIAQNYSEKEIISSDVNGLKDAQTGRVRLADLFDHLLQKLS